MLDLVTALGMVGAVAAVLLLFARWTKDFSDLLWMLSLRSTPVAIACLAVSGVIWALNSLLFGLPPLSPTSFLIVLILGPIGAVPAADAVACWQHGRRSATATEKGAWRGFIFARELQHRSDAYEAPPIEP